MASKVVEQKKPYVIPRFKQLTKRSYDEYTTNMMKRIKGIMLPMDRKGLINIVISYHKSGDSPYSNEQNDDILKRLERQLENLKKEHEEHMKEIEIYEKFTK